MSTPDNPESGQLTRRQLREQRTTGSHPVIGARTAVATQEAPSAPAPKAPLPRPARPVAVAPAPLPDAAVDLGVSPLTRRQARQQERIRTASVPVITPEVVAGHGYAPVFTPPAVVPQPEQELWTPAVAEERAATAATPVTVDEPATGASQLEELMASAAPQGMPAETAAIEAPVEAPSHEEPTAEDVPAPAVEAAPKVDARLGENVRADDEHAEAAPVSFDDLLSRDRSGSSSAPHALILSHVPEASPLSAVTSTGEVIVTGIYNLPEGLGSQGHALGAADGKDIDASLVDGELPASSSPTPIAASAAISTVRGTGEIIRPPAPEKSNRLMLTLMITAGALALALVGLLVYVVASGVFN